VIDYSDFWKFIFHKVCVATQLKCGNILGNHFITNFPQNVPVKFFENRTIFGDDKDKSMRLTFLAHPVCCRTI